MSTLLATAFDLEQWANRLDSSGDLPKLIRQLILATEEDITQLDMRAGEGTRYGGYDGMVLAGKGNAFVPPDRSVWEMGVTKDVKGKAEGDYRKRTTSPEDVDPSQTVFVFVTPRRWAGKNAWVEEKRKAGEWCDVRVVDADDLETWLHLAPAVHVWISTLIGKNPGDCEDLETFGRHWREATLPPLPSELFLAGRGASVERLIVFVRGQAGLFTVRAYSQEEALVFIAATFEHLSPNERDALFARTVIVRTEHAWRQITLTDHPLIVLPTFQLTSTRVPRSHHVLIAAGQELAKTQAMEVLSRPPRHLIEEALQKAGISQERASSLAVIGRRSLLALRRQLSPHPEIHQPDWADADTARVMIPLLLAGSWDEQVLGDKQMLEAVTGRPYTDVTNGLVRYTTLSDPPLRRVGTVWFVTSKEDAWRLFAQFLIQQDIEHFQSVAFEVLSAVDPALELPREQQWMANAVEKSRPHSRYLREGIADTIALMAVRAGDDVLGATATGQDHATAIVMHLLEQANEDLSGRIWLSLADVLPLLAEAAPNVFLRAVEKAIIGEYPLILKLFTDQEGDSFTTRSAHPPLLWALERLAWSPDYLSRVALVLARLAQIDPGGRLANRPGSSLRKIFLAWYPQTAATLEQRLQVLGMLRKRVPAQAWKLMLSLLPRPSEGTDINDSPQWREWKPEEQERGVSSVEIRRVIDAVVVWMAEDIGADATRVCEVVERIGNLPSSSREKVFDVLESLHPGAFAVRERNMVWTKLRQHVVDHRKYAHAAWAMPSSEVDRLAALYEHFQPEDPIQQVAWLFTPWPRLANTVDDNNGTKPEEAVYEAQVAAAKHVYRAQGSTGLFSLIEAVEQPWILGWVLGRGVLVEAEEHQLLNELGASDGKRRQTASGYVAGRFLDGGWEWVDTVLSTNDSLHASTQKADFLLSLPCRAETWDRLEQSDRDTKRLYWTHVSPRVDNDSDSLQVVEQLLAYDRVWQALDLLACTLEKVSPSHETVLNVLEQAVRTPIDPSIEHTFAAFLYDDISQLFDYISQSGDVDKGRLARIEWALLLIFREKRRSFTILHRQLARDPAFFVDIVSAAYRANGEEPREVDEQRRFLAEQAYALLCSARVVPGTQDDETIDATELLAWVHETRQLLRDCKRLKIGDEWIGHLLHYAKPDDDGMLLPEVVRDLLETVSSEEIELGIVVAVSNERGAQWSNPLAGGHQERQMTEQYRLQAQTLQFLWPRTAEVLKGLAQGYEAKARFSDHNADLRQDGW